MKATIRESGTPSPAKAAIPLAAAAVEDRLGRKLQLRELSLLEEQDLLVAMGPHSENAAALRRAFYAARVAMIDGDPIAVPSTNRLYRAMMVQVGLAGIVAVIDHLTPSPDGEPLAVFDGEPGEYMMMPHEGGVAVFRVAAAAADTEIAEAKKS